RSVYLPAGARWVDFWNGQVYEGGRRIDAEAPIETMPLYVRAGSIVPMGPLMEYATQKPADTLELRIYPGADGKFTLYEDENDDYGYEKGKFAMFDFNWNDKTKTLRVSDTRGHFPGQLQQRVFRAVLVNGEHGSGVATTATAEKAIVYKGKAMSVRL
ncbi:MAG: DUF5110 domain-containing protein, partial [Bacteroidota bacterium]|nr:DUF5110 domain-containing protein [Bacteroidota bacterium]